MIEISRRGLCQALGISVVAAPTFLKSTTVLASDMDKVTIGWPSDIPSWDPEQRTVPDAQPIYKMVFDQPLDQAPDLKLIPKLVKNWSLAPDGLSLTLDFRDDVNFHDGSKMTTADFKYSFFDRVKAGHKIDVAQIWGFVTDVDVASPTHAVMHFKLPFATSAIWLAFLCSYVVPKDYFEKVGEDGFVKAPIGTGPYKLVDYELNSRIVLERNEAYWGPKPKMKNVTFQIIKDPSARVAAIQSGQVDLTLNVPVREADRFKKDANFKAELDPIQRVIIIQARGDLAFADKNVRLAAHHAIDKKALSQAFYGGTAVPLSVVAPPDTPGYVEGYTFAYDVELAKKLLADSGSARRSRSRSSWRRPMANSRATTIWRGLSRRCGRRSALMPKLKSSSTRNTSSLTAATSCRRRHSTVGITPPAIRRYLPAICSILTSRSRRGRKKRSVMRSPRFLPLPTTTSGSPPTKRSTRRRWSTGPSCRSCKA